MRTGPEPGAWTDWVSERAAWSPVLVTSCSFVPDPGFANTNLKRLTEFQSAMNASVVCGDQSHGAFHRSDKSQRICCVTSIIWRVPSSDSNALDCRAQSHGMFPRAMNGIIMGLSDQSCYMVLEALKRWSLLFP